MKLDFLVVGAHPDDIELSCGGTIIKLVKSGKKVGLVDLTEGELGTRGSAELRAREARSAATILGTAIRQNLGIPDGNIANTMNNRLKLIHVIRKYRPTMMIFPYSIDRHPDHANAHTLCREAWFFSGLEKIATTLQGRKQAPFRPRAWINFMQWHEFTPSFIVDITDEYDQRMKAVRAYRSQFYNPESREPGTVLSSAAFLEMVRTRCEYYGTRINRKYGEPFHSPNSIGIDDLDALTF